MEPQGATIRAATSGDIAAMRNLEVDAGRRFDAIGMKTVADDAPPAAEDLAAHMDAGAAWIAIDDTTGEPVGYAVASLVDGEGHLDQVSVSLAAAGRRIGSALVDEVVGWTRGQGLRALTLTTFRDVAWNGPLYRRLGFEPLDEVDLGPELTTIRRAERDRGIEVAPRIAMRRML